MRVKVYATIPQPVEMTDTVTVDDAEFTAWCADGGVSHKHATPADIGEFLRAGQGEKFNNAVIRAAVQSWDTSIEVRVERVS